MCRFASWIEGGSGFVSLMHILDEEGSPPTMEQLRAKEEELQGEIQAAGIGAFARAVFTYPTESVLPVLLGAHGIGEVRANTVLVNRLEGSVEEIDRGRRKGFARQLRVALRAGCNLIVLDADPEEIEALDATPMNRRRIDVWYRRDATGRLSLMLAYLTTRTPDWKDAEIRLIAPRLKDKKSSQEMDANLRKMLAEVRIEAEPVIVDDWDPETLLKVSGDASLVFLPFIFRGGQASAPGGRPIAEAGQGLPVVAFAMAVQDLELDADPEGGKPGELAAAADRAADAMALARTAWKEAEKADKEVAALRSRADAPATDEELRAAEESASAARAAAERAQAKAAEAAAAQSGPADPASPPGP
jgi:hypothetical protein